MQAGEKKTEGSTDTDWESVESEAAEDTCSPVDAGSEPNVRNDSQAVTAYGEAAAVKRDSDNAKMKTGNQQSDLPSAVDALSTYMALAVLDSNIPAHAAEVNTAVKADSDEAEDAREAACAFEHWLHVDELSNQIEELKRKTESNYEVFVARRLEISNLEKERSALIDSLKSRPPPMKPVLSRGPTPRKLTYEQEQEVIRRFNAKESISSIARRMNAHTRTISRYLTKQQLKNNKL